MPARRLLACLLTASMLVASACGGDDDEATSPVTVDPDGEKTTTTDSTTTTAPTTTEAPDDPRKAVEQAFFAQWDAFVEILADPDPDNPLIDEHFTKTAKKTLLETIEKDRAEGYITRRPPNPEHFKPSIETIELSASGAAIVVECTVDGLQVIDENTGEIVNDRVVTVRYASSFELEDGRWKIASSDVLDRKEGVHPCD